MTGKPTGPRPKGICKACAKVIAVKRDGTIQAHGWTGLYGAGDLWCQGSGQKGWALPKPQGVAAGTSSRPRAS